MIRKVNLLTSVLLIFLSASTVLPQSGPKIKVSSVYDRDLDPAKYKYHITVSDPDGILSARYMGNGGLWIGLPVNPPCKKVETWSLETYYQILAVQTSDCCFCGIDSTETNQSIWQNIIIYKQSEGPVSIVAEWPFQEVKENLEIVSVEVTSGDILDENGESLDPSDFFPVGNPITGYKAKIQGTGNVEVVLDPAGDMGTFLFTIQAPQDSGLSKYVIGFAAGVIFLSMVLFLQQRYRKS